MGVLCPKQRRRTWEDSPHLPFQSTTTRFCGTGRWEVSETIWSMSSFNFVHKVTARPKQMMRKRGRAACGSFHVTACAGPSDVWMLVLAELRCGLLARDCGHNVGFGRVAVRGDLLRARRAPHGLSDGAGRRAAQRPSPQEIPPRLPRRTCESSTLFTSSWMSKAPCVNCALLCGLSVTDSPHQQLPGEIVLEM